MFRINNTEKNEIKRKKILFRINNTERNEIKKNVVIL